MLLLAIVDRVVFTDLSGSQQVQGSAAADRPGLCAEHRADANAPAPDRSARHRHRPVHAAKLAGLGATGAMAIARLVQELAECSAVNSQVPSSPGTMKTVHGRHR